VVLGSVPASWNTRYDSGAGNGPQAFASNLQGEKLRGSLVFVKLQRSEKGNEWLMIKHQDDGVDLGWNIDEHDGSALTGRTLDEIAKTKPRSATSQPDAAG
jgi:hypothetical protein